MGVPDSVAALWRDGALQRLDLQPLGHADCVTLVKTVLGGAVDPVSERRLWQLTRGNVRFIRDIVEQELAAGRIRRDEGIWTWLPGPVVPSTVCELIEHQMGELPEAVAETVDLLAVAEPLTSQMLVDMVGAGPAEEAERRALIVVEGRDEPQVRLAHPLYGAVRRARAGSIRLQRLRGMVAARLAAEACRDARHCVRRGALILDSDIVPSAEDMLRAAEAALWRGDGALSLRFARAAVAAGGGWRAALATADALCMAGQLSEAESVLTALGDELAPEAVVQHSLRRALNTHLQGRTDESVITESGFEAMRAFLAAGGADFSAALHAADAALASPAPSDFSVLLATVAKVIALGETGESDRIEQIADAAVALGTRSPATSFLRFVLAEATSSALRLCGCTERAEAAVDRVRDEDQPPDIYSWVSMMTGADCVAAGLVELAVRQIRDVLASSRLNFLGGWLCRYRIDLAIALAIRGEADAAEQCLRRFESLPHPTVVFLEPMKMLARAWISASVGAVSRAIAESRDAASTAAARGQLAREVLCLQAATRFGDTTTVSRLAELSRMVGGPRVAAAAAHAAALAAGDGDELMAVSGRHEAMGDLLSAVDAAAQASVAFTRENRRGSTLSAAARYRGLAERCGAVHTPAIAAATAPPIFTGREREIISLAGRGLTNREIAARLQLSVRTVEGHIYRAAGRVGARDRKELAQAIFDALPATA
jgi:DNA-binding NarL/FixJ family response regulator